MKTDTTKFLAVLAVFAMAFAGFALITADDSDAVGATVVDKDAQITNGVVITEKTLAVNTKDQILTAGVEYTLDAKLGNTMAFYLLPGAKITVSAETATQNLTFAAAYEKSSKYYGTTGAYFYFNTEAIPACTVENVDGVIVITAATNELTTTKFGGNLGTSGGELTDLVFKQTGTFEAITTTIATFGTDNMTMMFTEAMSITQSTSAEITLTIAGHVYFEGGITITNATTGDSGNAVTFTIAASKYVSGTITNGAASVTVAEWTGNIVKNAGTAAGLTIAAPTAGAMTEYTGDTLVTFTAYEAASITTTGAIDFDKIYNKTSTVTGLTSTAGAASGTLKLGTTATVTMDSFVGVITTTAVTTVTSGSLTLVKGTFAAANELQIPVGATLNVASEAILTVHYNGTTSAAATKALTVLGALYVSGTIKSDDATYAAVMQVGNEVTLDKAVFKTRAGATMTKIDFDSASTGTVDITTVINEVGLSGSIESSNTYTASQLVKILDDLTITNHAVITIHGYLEVPANVKLTITDGSALIIEGVYSESDIEGEIEIAKDSAMYIKLDKAFDVSGTLTTVASGNDYASLRVASNLTAEAGSTFDLTGATLIETADVFSIETGATVYVHGDIMTDLDQSTDTSSKFIKNAGTIVFDGAKISKVAVSADATKAANGFLTASQSTTELASLAIRMAGDGAKIEVDELRFNTTKTEGTGENAVTTSAYLFVTDLGINATETTATQAAVDTNSVKVQANVLVGITGLVIGEKVSTTINASDELIYTKNNMNISGTVARIGVSVADTEAVTIDVTQTNNTTDTVKTKYKSFSVVDELALEKNVSLIFNGVTQAFVNSDVEVEEYASIQANGASKIVINGSIESYSDLTAATFYNFCVGAQFKADAHSFVITTVHAAMTFAAVQEGKVTVTIYGKNTITENMYITANVKMVAGTGAKITINKDIAVEVIEGASVAVDFVVNGTLYANVEKNVTGDVKADVKVTDGVAAKWTSLANALATSEAGDIIIITNTTLTISDSLVIPEEVTVVIPDGTTASIADKKTLTVNGWLISDAPITLTGAAKIVVNGLARFIGNNVATINEKYGIADAYYTEDNYVYVSNLELASQSEVTKITIYGTVTESKEVSFALQTIELATGAVLKVSDLTLSELADIDAEKGKLSGNVTAGGLDGEAVAIMQFTDYTGKVGAYLTSLTGTAFIDEITGTVSVVGGTVTLAYNDTLESTGTLNVLPGAEFVVYEDAKLTLADGVNTGTIYVAGELTITSDDFVNAGIINVVYDEEDLHAGVLNVSEMTMAIGEIIVDDGAKFNLTGSLAIGIPDTSVAGVATIEGIVNIESASVYIIAYANADVSEMIVNPNSDGASTAKTTEFYINDMLYMTLIAAQNNTVKMYADVIDENVYVDIEELDCSALNTGKAAERCLAWGLTSKDVIGSTEKISIDLDYKLIAIQASWVKGLSLYVDGVRISTPGELKLSVGVHLVSVTVDAGYACDNIGITFNGVAVTPAGIFVEVDDTGSVLAVTGDVYIPEPEPVTPEEKSEWTITTILLVVLVILIAIMAVIVALRLNRS